MSKFPSSSSFIIYLHLFIVLSLYGKKLFIQGLISTVLLSIFQFSLIEDTNAKGIEMKGMTYTTDRYCNNVTLDSPRSKASLYHLRTTGANYVAFVVTEFMDHYKDNKIKPRYKAPFYHDSYYVYRTATIEQLTGAIKYAKSIGFKVMLKPHVDLVYQGTGAWRGQISGKGTAWFNSYINMITKYAKLAEKLKVEILSIGCELVALSSQTPQWIRVIQKIRKVYRGKLTDSANWGGQEQTTRHWNHLDYIGVDAYYNQGLGRASNTPAQIKKQWKPIVQQLAALSKKWKKPVIITELGFCSGNGRFKCSRNAIPTPNDLKKQAREYEGFLLAFKDQPWFKGVFWWNWVSDFAFGGEDNKCMTPQFKPAEKVLRKYYGELAPQPPRPTYPPLCICTL